MKNRLYKMAQGIPLLVLAVLFQEQAGAVVLERSFVQGATGVCQSALPLYERLIRKRPLAIQNEGDSNAFVSCSLMGTAHSATGFRSIDRVQIGLINFSGATVGVTCTLVDGVLSGNNTYFTKIFTVPVTGGSSWDFAWVDATDNGGQNFFLTSNISCNLPPGTGISYTIVYYAEDVG